MTSCTYDIADFINATDIILAELQIEVDDSSIVPVLNYIECVDDVFTFYFSSALSPFLRVNN